MAQQDGVKINGVPFHNDAEVLSNRDAEAALGIADVDWAVGPRMTGNKYSVLTDILNVTDNLGKLVSFEGDGDFKARLGARTERAKELRDFQEDKRVVESNYVDLMVVARNRGDSAFVISTSSGGSPIVIKVAKQDEKSLPYFNRDIATHRLLDARYRLDGAPHLVRMFGGYLDRLLVLKSFGVGATLDNLGTIPSGREIQSETAALEFFFDIVMGTKELYEAGIEMWGDASLGNCLVNILVRGRNRVAISDFSLSSSGLASGRGTPQYMAPERVGYGGVKWPGVGKQSDVFALGVMFYRMISGGKDPFNRHTLGVENMRNSNAMVNTAFASFILENGVENVGLSEVQLKEFSRTFGYQALSSAGSQLFDPETRRKLDIILTKALSLNYTNRFPDSISLFNAVIDAVPNSYKAGFIQ